MKHKRIKEMKKYFEWNGNENAALRCGELT
jgi:hypothetical protein